jgi:hypothetical protein
MALSHDQPRWLMLVFSLPAKRASERVEVWRKLKRMGALPLPSSGHLLPLTPQNRERFEWLAASIRRYKGSASVIQLHSIDDLPSEELMREFLDARSRDYAAIIAELNKVKRPLAAAAQLARLRRRYQEVAEVDFFDSPLRSRVESMLARKSETDHSQPRAVSGKKKKFQRRTWLTRPRPGIDRVSSAWLITKFIDPAATFAFAADVKSHPDAVPFDMFQGGGFGHRGEDCTFETLRKEFAIRDPKVAAIAEMIHDADLDDAKFGRSEGLGLDRVLIGWAQQGVPDDDLLRRGMQLIEGLYNYLSSPV